MLTLMIPLRLRKAPACEHQFDTKLHSQGDHANTLKTVFRKSGFTEIWYQHFSGVFWESHLSATMANRKTFLDTSGICLWICCVVLQTGVVSVGVEHRALDGRRKSAAKEQNLGPPLSSPLWLWLAIAVPLVVAVDDIAECMSCFVEGSAIGCCSVLISIILAVHCFCRLLSG